MNDTRFETVKHLFHHDTLLRRVILASGALVAVMVTAAIAVAALWIFPLCEKIEVGETKHRTEIVGQAFRAQVDRLADVTRTFAVWDDTYSYVRGRNPDYIHTNYDAQPLRQIDVDAVLIFDESDQLLYSTVAEHARVSNRMLLSVSGAAVSAPGLMTKGDSVRTAIVTAPSEAALVSVARIARSDGSGPSSGRLVFVRGIDEPFVAHLRQRTDTRLKLVLGESIQSAVKTEGGEYIVADAYGRPGLSFAFPDASGVAALGRGALILIAAITAGALLIMAWVVTRLMLQGVVRPVRALLADIDAGLDSYRDAPGSPGAPLDIVRLRQAFAEASKCLREETKRERAATEEAERARSLAEIANRARSHFVGRVSHELRTPLHAVISYGELLEESLAQADREQDRSDLDRLMLAARRLLSHVNNLIDMARLESGRMPLARNAIDMDALIRRAAEDVKPQADAEKTRISLKLDPGLGVVTSDEVRLSQCLSNLLSNAVKFAPGGEVIVSARRGRRRDDESIVVSVTDNGSGMSAEQLNRAFEPFMQAEEDGHLKNGGLGLGLTITRGLVNILGGKLDAESEPGKGTRFRIILPVEAAPARPFWTGEDRAA